MNVFEEDGELVAAESRDRVAGAGRHAEPFADRLEQFVARRVSQRVVDVLEVVEVDHHDGEAAACTCAPLRRMLEPVEEHGSIGELCQFVVKCPSLELARDFAPLRCIPHGDDDAAYVAVVEQVREGHLEAAFVAAAGEV